MVLVINDNLYGLIFALSYICRCPFACLSPFVGVKVLLVLHVLESRLREDDHLLIKAKVFLHEHESRGRSYVAHGGWRHVAIVIKIKAK